MTFATLSTTLKSGAVTLSGGNLTATQGAVGGYVGGSANSFASSGVLQCEFTIGSNLGYYGFGLADGTVDFVGGFGNGPAGCSFAAVSAAAWEANGQGDKGHNNVSAAYYLPDVSSTVVGMVWDAGATTLTFYANGVSQGTAYTGVTGSLAPYYVNFNGGAMTANFGATAFAHPVGGATGWPYVPLGIVATAPVPKLVTGTNGIIGFAPKPQLNIGFSQIVGKAPVPTLSALIPKYGVIATAPKPTLVLSGLTGEIGTVTAAAPAPVLVATLVSSATLILTGTAPAPTLSATGISGEASTFSGTVPAPTVFIGVADIRIAAPAPTLDATIASGTIIKVSAVAPAPVLVATLGNPAIITAAMTAPAPRLSAVLAAGRIGTASLSAPAPRLSASILTGNVATFLGQAVAPIMAAAGYPAYILSFSGTAPVPRLSATLGAAVAANYLTYVLNTRKSALTEYGPEWAFNSYAFFNGRVIACSSSGIVELGLQSKDNATTIDAKFRTGQEAFGSSALKRLPRAYASLNASGDMTFRTITAEGGVRSYLLGWNNASGLVQRRVPIGKGPKSRFWQVELENVAGADFSVNDILLMPVALRRRVQ